MFFLRLRTAHARTVLAIAPWCGLPPQNPSLTHSLGIWFVMALAPLSIRTPVGRHVFPLQIVKRKHVDEPLQLLNLNVDPSTLAKLFAESTDELG